MGIGTRLLLGSLAFAFMTWSAWSAKKELIPPPQGKTEGIAEVQRGGRVTIHLIGIDRNLRRLEFAIDRPPRSGRLGAISVVPGSSDRATVVYTHGDDDDSTEDSFDFTVRAASGGPAGRATVKIRITDQPATLLAPAQIDFGEVVIGETAQRKCEISNLGGSLLEGDLEAPEPFSVQGPGEFLLKRGARRNFTINFSPTNPGPYTFRVQPSPHDPAVIELKGEALPPFTVRADAELFTVHPDDTRSATLKVSNNSSKALSVAVKLPPDIPITAPGNLQIPGGETRTVELRIPPEHKKFLPKFPVQLVSSGYNVACEFSAPAIPPRLIAPTEPDFGEIQPGRTAEAKLVVQNTGGIQADFEVQMDESLSLLDAPPAISLAPGASREISLQLRSKKNRELTPLLRLIFQGNAIPVKVRAKLVEPEAPVTRAANETEPQPDPTPPPPPYALNQDIVLAQSGTAARLEWTEKPDWSGFRLEQQTPGSEIWLNYEPPQEPEGVLAWIASQPQKIRDFLDTPIQRNEPGSPPAEKRGGIPLESTVIGSSTIWRLRAIASGGTEPQNLTPDFLITQNGLVASPEKTTAPPPPPPISAPSIEQRSENISEEPVTKIESAGIKSEKYAADLRIALARDPEVVNYRLERGAMIAEIDPASGIPRQPRFEPVPHEGGRADILGFSHAESEGRNITIVAARIEGLPPGSRTYWRLVPMTQNGDRPPTSTLLVDTISVPPFSWRNFFLWCAFALLAGVMFLRWRINRIP